MGGLDKVEALNKEKAETLYSVIDNNEQYYCVVNKTDRSTVNICFNLQNKSMESTFLEEASTLGLINLKGHGARGGIRASLYNAMPKSGVDSLINFMQNFSF
jgi:phosphoserine aminotransferase